MIEILKNTETDTKSDLDELKKDIHKHPDKDPDDMRENDPAAVKDIPLQKEYLTEAKDLFIVTTEFLNKNIDDIDKVNAARKNMNKDIRTTNPFTIDGVKVARIGVASRFEVENGQLILKTESEKIKKEIIHETEATITSVTYK